MEAEVVHIEQAKAAVHPSIRQQATRGRKPVSPADKVMREIVRDGLLPFHVRMGVGEALALRAFLKDAYAAWGESGALSPIDYNRPHGGGGNGFLPAAISTDAYHRANAVWDRMHKHEQVVMIWLGQARARHNITLSLFGRECGNHSQDDNSAAQQGVGLMLGIARTAMECYDVRDLYDAGTHKRKTDVPKT